MPDAPQAGNNTTTWRWVERPLDDPGAPVGVIIGEFTAALQQAYRARGVNILTVDYRDSLDPTGLHYRGDAREVVFRRRWKLLIAHPTCRDVARSGQASFPAKIASGAHWWGLADILFWFCAPADAVIIEQPIGAFEAYYMPPSQSLQPWMFGAGFVKTWRLFCSDNVPSIRPTRVVAGRAPASHGVSAHDPELREQLRSITPAGIATAIASQVTPGRLAPRTQPAPQYSREVQRLAATYKEAGHRLPADFDHPLAAPPTRPPSGTMAAHGAPEADGAALAVQGARAASMHLMHHGSSAPLVIHCEVRARCNSAACCSYTYIGRAGARFAPPHDTGQWGNPTRLTPKAGAGARAAVVSEYAVCLAADPARIEMVRRQLRGRELGCYCAPRLCHGHVLAYVSNCGEAELAGWLRCWGPSAAKRAWPERLVRPEPTADTTTRFLRRKLEAGAELTPAQGRAAHELGLIDAGAAVAPESRGEGVADGPACPTGSPPSAATSPGGDEQGRAPPTEAPAHAGPPLVACPAAAGSTVVVPVCVRDTGRAPKVLVGADAASLLGSLPATPTSRDAAVEWAQRLAPLAGISANTTFLAGEMGAAGPRDAGRLRVVMSLTRDSSATPAGLVWRTLSELSGTPLYRLGAAVVQRALAMREPVVEEDHGLIMGGSAEKRPRQRGTVPQDPGCPSVAERAVAAAAACEELRETLRNQTGDAEWVAFATAMADRVQEATIETVPPELREARFDLRQAGLEMRPFRHPCTRITSSAPPPPPPPPADDGWRPHWVEDIYERWALRALRREYDAMVAWTRRKVAGENVDHLRPRGIALGEDARKPRARGRVWDLRGGPGQVVPLDENVPLFDTHLDLNFIQLTFADSPDREIFAMFAGGGAGVNFRDELPLQTVILPNLLSLFDGIDAVADEITALEKRGWYGAFDAIPFSPFRAPPRGSAKRADGGPPRGVGDQGGPRRKMLTLRGREPVPSMNGAAREAGWGSEPKPSISTGAHNHAILLRLADIGMLVLLVIAMDYKYFFHQLIFATRAAWKMGALLPMRGPDDTIVLRWAVEYVMTMGAHPSSRIAQRLANELIAKLLQLFDEADAAYLDQENAALQQAMAARGTLAGDDYGTNARLADALQYTDDPLLGVVGVARTVRMLRTFYTLVGPRGMRMMLAGMHKMNLGGVSKWLGAMMASSLGCVWVPPAKLLHAAEQVRAARDGRMQALEYRKLFGFLVSLLFMLGDDATMMHFLEDPLRAGGELAQGPTTLVRPTAAMRRSLDRWRITLLSMAGTSVLAAVTAAAPQRVRRKWRLNSDAAREPQDEGPKADGMGGALFNRYWSLPLTARLRALPIPVLEFLAHGVNLLVFDQALEGVPDVVSGVDAKATVQGVTNRSKAAAMRVVLEELVQLEAYQGRVRRGEITYEHDFGPGHVMADAASRGYGEVIDELCEALGVEPVQVPLPRTATAFLERCLSRCEQMGLTLQAPVRSRPLPKRTEDPAQPGGPAIRHRGPSDDDEESPPRMAGVAPTAAPQYANDGATSPPRLAGAEPAVAPATHRRDDGEIAASPLRQAGGKRAASPPASPRRRVMGGAASPGSAGRRAGDGEAAAMSAHRHSPRCRARLGSGSACVHLMMSSLMLASTASASSRAADVFGRSGVIGDISDPQQARAATMFEGLRGDKSRWRIGASDERMLHMCEQALDALADGQDKPRGNQSSDWRQWVAYCAWANILPWRADPTAALGLDPQARERESVIWINALLYIWPRMQKAKGRTLPAKPSSALAILRSIRRMHRKLDMPVISMAQVVRAMNKKMEEYRDEHGPEALQPQRKEPLTTVLILGLLAVTKAAPMSELDRLRFTALWEVMAQTGMRKAEVSMDSREKFGLKHVSWDNVCWLIGGVRYPSLTPELYARMGEGDMLILRPPPSKADQFGLRWAPSPIYLPFSSTAPLCAARAVAALEMARRIPSGGRRNLHMFADATGEPLRKGVVDRRFREWMLTVVPRGDEASRYSPHSFRIYLCTALAEAGASDARIQSMLRWASEDAMLVYKRTDQSEYAAWTRAAASAEFDTIRTHNLPTEAARDGQRARFIRHDCDELVGVAMADADAMLAMAEAADAEGS